MAKTREIRRRIKSVENTRQITKTMEMVATAKIKRAQERIEAARPYAFKMMEVLSNVATDTEAGRHPLLAEHDEIKTTVIVALTSDRGLCGAFNSNILRMTESLVAEERAAGREVKLMVSGKKGITYFNWVGLPLLAEYRGISDRPAFDHAKGMADIVIDGYTSAAMDRVWLVFNRFKNVAEQKPTKHLLLPVEREAVGGDDESAAARDALAGVEPQYVFEPSSEAVLEHLLPTYIEALVYRALLESAASEHGARRTAMKSASDNAQDMIGSLVRSFNRARQAQITQEIAEIVGGADALKEAG